MRAPCACLSHPLRTLLRMEPLVIDAVGKTVGQTPRAARWARTHQGFGADGPVRRAHDGLRAANVTVGLPSLREEREAEERASLASGATLATGAGHRAVEEEPDPHRTCFERDRDRILHSQAFRRLAGKTQVFVFPRDHQRTRLTHALEVAQVATSIARACRLNVALTEAIALAHDCGHGPGGHASEEALSVFLPDGYDHAVFGADIVLRPLNLCAETLDGVRNHSWSRPAPATPEAEVVSWADRIAYLCHDFEDAVHAGVVRPDELPPSVRELCGTDRSGQIDVLVHQMINTIATTGQIGLDHEHAEVLATFRAFNHERIYLRPASIAQAEAVIAMLRALVEHYCEHPELLPAGAHTTNMVEAAVAYVGGMTDRFACEQAVRLLGWSTDRLPRGFDVAA